MQKVTIEGTHQRVTPAGAAWIDRQIVEFRAVHHRDPEHGEIFVIVMRWRVLERDTATRRSTRRQHAQECASSDYKHPRPMARRFKK